MKTILKGLLTCATAAVLVATAGAETIVRSEPGRTTIIRRGVPTDELGTGQAAGASSDHGLRSGSTSSDNGQGVIIRRIVPARPGVRHTTIVPDDSAAGVGHVSTGTGD
jgi:hypothetical protein